MMINNNTAINVCEEIEKITRDKKVDYIDAVVLFAESRKVEIEVIADLIRSEPAMKMKLLANAQDLNMVKGKGAKLPI